MTINQQNGFTRKNLCGIYVINPTLCKTLYKNVLKNGKVRKSVIFFAGGVAYMSAELKLESDTWDHMEKKIMALILKNMDHAGKKELSFDDKITDTGVNSIAYISVVVDIENEFGITVDEKWLVYDEGAKLEIFLDMVKDSVRKGNSDV